MTQLNLQSLFTVNEVEIHYRNKKPYQDRIQITRSATAYEILRQAWDENKLELLEQFRFCFWIGKTTVWRFRTFPRVA